MADLSIIIVTWNNEKEITACIDSVIANISKLPALKVELILIDNASSDKTYEILRKMNYSNLQIHQNLTNIGFTRAVNQGIRYASGNYIFLLNPDSVLNPDCLEKLYSFLENNDDYTASCPMLTNEDGSVQYSIRNFPTYGSMYSEFYLLSFIFPKSKIFNHWKWSILILVKIQMCFSRWQLHCF